MADPTEGVRQATYNRDGRRCVSCGARIGLQYQHRQTVGQGGSKIRPTITEGVTSCAVCNEAYEHTLQKVALKYGWKVRQFIGDHTPADVPVYYLPERTWYRLTLEGTRVPLTVAEAVEMMREVYGPAYDPERGLVKQ